MNIFVGNLLFDATEADVKKLFERFGSVASVAIVMDKKGKKSRGFGFVQMPDDLQAVAAIAAVDGKDFMGRALNVSPAHPKSEVKADSGRRKKILPDFKGQAQPYPQEVREQKNVRGDTAFNNGSRYKQGRRSRSFMVRRAAAGIEAPSVPRKKSHENPMRWRKKRAYPTPTPWKKTESGEPKPLRKTEGGFKPWGEKEGRARPWRKSEGEPKPWRKSEGTAKPWEKKEGRAKPWRKSSDRPRQSSFKSRKKPGSYRR